MAQNDIFLTIFLEYMLLVFQENDYFQLAFAKSYYMTTVYCL